MLLVKTSENSKLGPISATYRGKQTCPANCALFKTCYAKTGGTNFQFINATKKHNQEDGARLIEFIKTLSVRAIIRHFVSGDIIKNNKTLDRSFISSLIKAHKVRKDVIGFGYTHSWKRFSKNPFKQKNLTINASCEKVTEVKAAKKKGFDTVLVLPHDAPDNIRVWNGIKILPCPNQVAKRRIENGKACLPITCDKCLLCAKQKRKFTIGFYAHGPGKKMVGVELS